MDLILLIFLDPLWDSADMLKGAYQYNLGDIWDKMSHLDGDITVNPITQMDKNVQNEYYTPKEFDIVCSHHKI